MTETTSAPAAAPRKLRFHVLRHDPRDPGASRTPRFSISRKPRA
jgi:hypothetical protein